MTELSDAWLRVDLDSITWLICEALRDAGIPVRDQGPDVEWHLRCVVDYGNGPAMTSPAQAFDHLIRARNRERRLWGTP